MSKKTKLVLMFLVIIFSCTPLHAGTTRRKILVPAFNISPLFIFSEDGKPSGVGYDLLKEMAILENWDLEVTELPIKDLLHKFETDRDENVSMITFLAFDKEREKFLDYTKNSVLNICGTLITTPENRLQKLSDLRDKDVVILEAGLPADVFKDMILELDIDCNIIRVKNYPELLDFVVAHPESVGLINNYTFYYYSTFIKYEDLVSTLLVLPSFSEKYAVRKGMDSDILETVNSYLEEWKRDSSSPFAAIYEKWDKGKQVERSLITRLSTLELLSVPIVLFTLLLWIVLLRYRIRVNTKKIQSKELDLKATLMSIGDGVLVIDTNRNILNINPVATKLLATSNSEVASISNLFTLLDSETREVIPNPIDILLTKKSLLNQYGTCLLQNVLDEQYIINYTASPIYLETTQKGVVFVFRDITEEARNIDIIAQSEREKSQMLESVNEAIFVYDIDLKLVNLNNIAKQTVYARTGRTNVIGLQCTQLMHNSKIPCEDCPAQSVISSKKTIVSIKEDKFGSTFQIKYTPILNNNNEITGLIEAILDISELKLTEKALRISENNYRMLIENQSDIVIKLNPAGKILFATKSCCDFFGVEESDFTGHSYLEFTAPEDHKEALEAINYFAKDSIVKRLELHHPTPSGLRCVSWQLSVVLDDSAEIDYVIATGSDITDIKLANEQLQHVQKLEAIGQLAGGVAHDFNNMLGGIVGYAELIIMKSGDNKTIKKYSKQIIDTGEKAAELTQQLLSFARKGKASSTPIDAHTSIKRAIDILSRSIDKNVKIELALNAKNSMIIGDPTQIQNTILNLGINARDAIGNNTEGCFSIETATISLSEEYCSNSNFDITPQDYILIKARDNGIGMEKEVLEHIFEPFFTTKEIGKGTGLGLASIFGAVTSHFGAITVDSEPGLGTEFDIFLPVIGYYSELPDPETSTDVMKLLSEARHKVVLVIDDEEVIREVAKSLLENLGYDVLLAKDGVEGIDIFIANMDIISLVLLDVIMPRMGGKETLKKLIKLDPNVNVIIASGFSQSDRTEDFTSIGAKAFIKKPYKQRELLDIIKKILPASD